jgi:hypothetical protein
MGSPNTGAQSMSVPSGKTIQRFAVSRIRLQGRESTFMKTQRTLQSLVIVGSVLLSGLCPLADAGGGLVNQKIRIDRRTITPNRPAPELYADKLSLKITLMNLPGAEALPSSWQVEYKVYFVAEQDFEKTVREMNKAGKGCELRPEHFQSKILLAEGQFSKQKLASLKERGFLRQGIPFRGKVPHELQTSFSSIMSFYSVKVFDAKLKKNIYGSDVYSAAF